MEESTDRRHGHLSSAHGIDATPCHDRTSLRLPPVNLLYRMALAVLRLVSPLLSVGGTKLARGLAGRRFADETLVEWGRRSRDPARPVVWVHAPSVGEGLQAKAVMDALLARRPEAQIVYTFFSPSAESLADRFGADVAGYLPWDLRRPCAKVLTAIEPDLLVFTKTEVWPVLVGEARRQAIPVAIAAGSVPDGAGRTSGPARALLRPAWEALALACACTEEDGDRLVDLGVARERVRVTGDPGVDSAVHRIGRPHPDVSHVVRLRPRSRPTVVAGSTWRADEDVLVPALDRVRAAVGEVRLVIAPHEPSDAHVNSVMLRLEDAGWTPVRLGRAGSEGAPDAVDAVIVDRVGVLIHLYALADVSYVGGGFHAAGLHSVIEPAAAGTPVVFGPRHRSTWTAGALLDAGGAKVATDPESLAGVIITWLRSPEARAQAARAALGCVERHRGAADRTAILLDDLLPWNR